MRHVESNLEVGKRLKKRWEAAFQKKSDSLQIEATAREVDDTACGRDGAARGETRG